MWPFDIFKKKDDFFKNEPYKVESNPFRDDLDENNKSNLTQNNKNPFEEKTSYDSNSQNNFNQNSFDNLEEHKNDSSLSIKSKDQDIYSNQTGSMQSDMTIQLINKNIEVLSYKMDSLKAEIDSMNQRVINIEKIAKDEYDTNKRKMW